MTAIEQAKKFVEELKFNYNVIRNPFDGNYDKYESTLLIEKTINSTKIKLLFIVYDKSVSLKWVNFEPDDFNLRGYDDNGKTKISCKIEEFNFQFIEKIIYNSIEAYNMYFKLKNFVDTNMFGFEF